MSLERDDNNYYNILTGEVKNYGAYGPDTAEGADVN